MNNSNNITASKAKTNPQFPQYQAWKIFRDGKLIGEIAVLKHLTASEAIAKYFS